MVSFCKCDMMMSHGWRAYLVQLKLTAQTIYLDLEATHLIVLLFTTKPKELDLISRGGVKLPQLLGIAKSIEIKYSV